MRGILINFEPPEEIKYQELESGNPYKSLDVPFFYALGNLETSLTQVTWY